MKKHFYSLWFRVVITFFWAMVMTVLLMGLIIHLMQGSFLWKYFPFTGLGFLALLAVTCVLLGTLISVAIAHHAVTPVTDLSKAMERVAEGDYTVKLATRYPIGELSDLSRNFNRMVQELNSTEILHSDFISNVSHEFKTPLASISGYATLLQDDSLSDEERNEYIEIIIKSAKDLSSMTGNILNLSRLETQTIISEKEYFSVDEQIRQIILRAEPAWSAKKLTIEPELESITWYGNQELTAHIWSNLLDNAVKFTSSGGEIDITARLEPDWLTVTFRDTGIGMSPEVQAHIFDKFYQGDTSHKKKGNGLGLALVKRIVSLYQGTIQLESIPDLGSTFTVRLPVEHPGGSS